MIAPHLPLLLGLLGAPQLLPLTVAEQSGFLRTGRYDEVVRLCDELQRGAPGSVRCLRFGTTPEGRPMLALVASTDGTLTPAAARERRRPVLLFQGGIHAGEIDGKDAGFLVLRELLARPAGPLRAVTVVFVPVFNVDGHERFGKNNRPNQNGPQEMGWRTSAQNLNINRDYAKAESPEMAAMLRLLGEWDPILLCDLHVTDGAQFQPDVAVLIEPQLAGPAALRPAGAALRQALFRRLEAQRHAPLSFYPSFEVDGDPASGFANGVPPPRFSNGYWPLRNRLGVLVETHSWKDYRTRVRATADTMRGLIDEAAAHGAGWLLAAAAAEEEARGLGGSELPLAYDHTDRATRLRFPGYAYSLSPSAVSGGLRVRYDPHRPAAWEVPFYAELKPTVVATVPRGGYVVPAAHAGWVAEKLRLHGLSFTQLAAPRSAAVEVFRITEKKFHDGPFEGRLLVQVKGAWRTERRRLEQGALLVPSAQPGSRILAHLMEPAGPDSLLSWGFFNAALEQKEYMEAYVAEEVAEQLLARDPALREEFQRKLKTDPAFARDPAQRLRFFHQHHPSWDDRYDLYPIYRLPTS